EGSRVRNSGIVSASSMASAASWYLSASKASRPRSMISYTSRLAGAVGSAASAQSGVVQGLAPRRMRIRVAVERVIGRDRLTADDASSLQLDFGHVELGQVGRRRVLHPESVNHLVFGPENGERLLHQFPTGVAQLDEISLADDLAI